MDWFIFIRFVHQGERQTDEILISNLPDQFLARFVYWWNFTTYGR